MMRYEITAEFTSAGVKAVARRFVIRLLGVGYFIALLLMALALTYLAINRVNEWTTGVIATILAMGILFPVALWWKTERSGLRRLQRMSAPQVRFVFDDKGVTADSELGAATVGWKSIEKIWEFPDAWLLFVGKQQYVTVPLPALTEELKQIIKAEVEKNKTGRPQAHRSNMGMKRPILAIATCGALLVGLFLFSADQRALVMADFSVGDTRMVITQARSWERTCPVYYRVRFNGKSVHGEYIIGVRRHPMPALSFSVMTDPSSRIIAIVESANPRTVLAVFDQSDKFSWPHDDSETARAKLQEKIGFLETRTGIIGLKAGNPVVPEVLGEQ